jgi:PPOX class probable F420-dependent enzyme
MPLTEDTLQRFLDGRQNAVVATIRRDGPPQLSTVWYRWTGEVFHISTQRHLQKLVNLRRDPRVTLCIDDPAIFTSVVVEGRAEVVDGDIWEATEAIAERYLDQPRAERLLARIRTQPRVLLVVHPEKWLSWDISPGMLSLA